MYEKKIKTDVSCPISHGLDMLGGKWKSRIICVLARLEPLRYGELRDEMANITDAALSNALRALESSHLIQRRQYNESPMRVEYALTPKGTRAVPLLLAIADWANGDIPMDRQRGDMPLCLQCRYNETDSAN